MSLTESPTLDDFRVICLCAEWCGTCRDYQPGFMRLIDAFPGVQFRWLDIEEQAEEMGDLDIEDFPTLLICRGPSILFFGTLMPYLEHLRRMIETFQEQTAEQSLSYARSSPERLDWQKNVDLRALCGGPSDE